MLLLLSWRLEFDHAILFCWYKDEEHSTEVFINDVYDEKQSYIYIISHIFSCEQAGQAMPPSEFLLWMNCDD